MPSPKRASGSLIRLLFFPYRWIFLGILGIIGLASLLEGLQVAFFFPVFQALLGHVQPGNTPASLRILMELVHRIPSPGPMVSAIGLLLAVTLLKSAALFARDSLVAVASGTIQHDLKMQLMRRYADCSYPFFLETKQGQLLYNLSTATIRVGVLAQKIPQMAAEACKILAIGLLLLATMPTVTGALTLAGLAYHALTRFLSQKISYHTGKGRVEASAQQASIANEFFSGIRSVMAYRAGDSWVGKFEQQSRRFRDLFIRDSVWLALPRVFLELGMVLIFSAFLLACFFWNPAWLNERLSLLAMSALAFMKILPSITLLGQLRMETAGLLGDAEVLEASLTQSPLQPKGGRKAFGRLESGIALDRLGFAYPGRNPLLRELTLNIEKGKVTALVGSSGSGKTTLAYLLLGLLEPNEGRILVDGEDLKSFDGAGWRGRIGFVPQDLFIFHASVTENITFGRKGFTPEAIRRAARLATAEAFIDALPQSFDTVVGEKGMKLSGGQQQRVAIARAILHDPEILLLDEATSFLDVESEKGVQQAMESASAHRTTLLIAHRLTTVRRADKIVVLESGRIVEEGSHKDLLECRGRYFEMLDLHREGRGG